MLCALCTFFSSSVPIFMGVHTIPPYYVLPLKAKKLFKVIPVRNLVFSLSFYHKHLGG